MALLTNGEDGILVLKDKGGGAAQVFRLDGMEQHGISFYGTFRRFEAGLDEDTPLSEQPYGRIGASCDLTGRMMGPGLGERLITTQGNEILTLEQPAYSVVGEYPESELAGVLEGYAPEQRDVPYATLTVSAHGTGWAGSDLYENTLFLMTGGYGIVAETSVIAGRAIEDCCSPEFHYAAHKVDLDDTASVIQALEITPVSGATLGPLTISVSPAVVSEFTLERDDWSSERGRLEDIVKGLLS